MSADRLSISLDRTGHFELQRALGLAGGLSRAVVVVDTSGASVRARAECTDHEAAIAAVVLPDQHAIALVLATGEAFAVSLRSLGVL